MHFNDLLMRLRTQSLAGIAAAATVVSLFTRSDAGDAKTDWLVAACVFSALSLFWLAIASIDLLYYNRLLLGAVSALVQLEGGGAPANKSGINMSTEIVAEFKKGWFGDHASFSGVYAFYIIVFVVIVVGAVFSFYMYSISEITNQSAQFFRIPV